jgi:ketosteroid isomerase-like protein
MKRNSIVSLLGLVLLTAMAWPQATEKAVAGLEDQWLQAQKTNNPDLLAPLLADKVVITHASGKVSDKAETLAEYKKMKFDSAEYSDVKVTVFGTTAIAVGNFKGKGTDPEGKPFDDYERWTDTWVKMPGGKWQCVASQSSSIKK